MVFYPIRPGYAWPIFVFFAYLTSIPVSVPIRSIIAINSGGPTSVAPDGTVFEQDRYYTGGTHTGPPKTAAAINGTDFPAMYQTARMTTGDEVWYSLPIPYNVGSDDHGWSFVLTLKFVELWYNQTDKRQFAVNLNGLPVLTNVDIVEEVGKGIAYDEDIEFKVSRGRVCHYVHIFTERAQRRVRL
jgi:hypothetical protein